jgi:hypothetical protein
MRGTILTASLAVLVAVSSVGCKSMPSLTWWRTADNSNANATAVAHAAPALPSDVAIQNEGLVIDTAPVTGGAAAPFAATAAPAVSPTGYPNTGAPSYSSTIAGSAPAMPAMNDSNLGTIDMPYNPNGVPPAATVAAAPPAAAPPTANRYAAPSAPAYTPTTTPANSSPQMADAGSRYGTQTPANTTPAYSPPPATSYAPPTAQAAAPPASSYEATNYNATLTSATGELGDRYAQPATTTAAPAAQPTNPVSQEQAIATSEPYRPGGTSTYPGAVGVPSNYEMAVRPEAPATTPGSSSSVPNVATPGDAPAPPQSAPQVPRYW